MADKIQRQTQKIFAGSATDDSLAIFGSFKTGNPIYTDNIEDLQSSSYEQGWEAAIVANEAPFMEEMNGIQYGFSKQLAYLFQTGMPEWDEGTEYFAFTSFCQINGVVYQSLTDNNIGNNPTTDTTNWQKFYAGLGLYSANTTYAKDFLVYSVTDGQVKFYLSLTDDNKGNDLTNTTYWQEISLGSGGSGSGLEVGDIGITAFPIDESKGLKRYLNGQTVAINANTQVFVDKLKSASQLYPSLVCSESEWQEISAKSVGGQCGKFVLDEEGGTVRLPKIIMPIQGLTDLNKLGELQDAGLPNIEGTFVLDGVKENGSANGAFQVFKSSSLVNNAAFAGINCMGVNFNASWFNPIYGNSNTVQQEQIQYPYYIVVATGATTEVNITNTLESNIPYFYGQSFYSQYKLSDIESENLSLLISLGQENAKAIYPDMYNWVLKNANKGIEGFKLSSADDITDYDFVVNTSDETFRLPLKTRLASGKAIVGNGKAFGLTDGTSNLGMAPSASMLIGGLVAGQGSYGVNVGQSVGSSGAIANVAIGITTDPENSGAETSDVGLYLYFYVGATVQNEGLIDAARIAEELPNKIGWNNSDLLRLHEALCPDYSAGISITLTPNVPYQVELGGWLYISSGSNYLQTREHTLLGSYSSNMSNPVTLYNVSWDGSSNTVKFSSWVYIPKGMYIQFNSGGAHTTTLYPIKGVK